MPLSRFRLCARQRACCAIWQTYRVTTQHDRQELRLFLVALQFLTRIPVRSFDGFQPEWLDRSAKYFPLVGALVGAIAAAVIVADNGGASGAVADGLRTCSRDR